MRRGTCSALERRRLLAVATPHLRLPATEGVPQHLLVAHGPATQSSPDFEPKLGRRQEDLHSRIC